MKNLIKYKIEELYDVSSGLSKSRNDFGFGNPFVTFKDVFYNYFLPNKLESLANTNEKEIKSCSVKKGDIFLTRTSETADELGMSSIALKDYPKATFNGFTKRLRLKENVEVEVDPVFIGYYFRSSPIRAQFGMHSSMSTRASLNNDAINSIEIKLPKINTQVKIGYILKCLDDKIELNRRMNQTLEQIVQTLFNHYFVDKIDPDNLPEEWTNGKLNEEFDIIMGQSPEGSSYNQEGKGIAFFQGRTDFNFRFPSFRIYTTSPKRFAKKFDVLISVRAPVGDLNIALTDCCIGRGIGAIRNKMGYMSYTYYKIKSLTEIFKPYNGEGTVFGSINKDELGNISVAIPSKEKVVAFEDLVRPMDLKIYELQKETENLSNIRDTLLPKLMSGKIDVDALMKEEILLQKETN